MKFEWKKHEKELYFPANQPTLITVPKQHFFMISGKGNPNDADFAARVGVLYALSYAVRMMPKQGITPEGYVEYTVYPLEGVWDISEQGRQSSTLDKNELLYTIMIRQPSFVTNEIANVAFSHVQRKKPHLAYLSEASFSALEDGLSVQMLHTGSYDEEPESFAKMDDYLSAHHLTRRALTHREIYLADARKAEQKSLQTVLRYQVDTN